MNNGAVHNSRLLTSPRPAHTTSNFAPDEYRGVVNPSALLFTKDQTQREGNSNCNWKEKTESKLKVQTVVEIWTRVP